MPRKCFICEAVYRGKSERKFHLFPKGRKKLWMKALGIDFAYATSTVCSDHFLAEDYELSGKLKPTAVPHKKNVSKLDEESSITDKHMNNDDVDKLCSESKRCDTPRTNSRLASAGNSIIACDEVASTSSRNNASEICVILKTSRRLAQAKNRTAAVTSTTSIGGESEIGVAFKRKRRKSFIKISVGAMNIAYSPVKRGCVSHFLRVYCLCGKCAAPPHLLETGDQNLKNITKSRFSCSHAG